MRKTQFAALFLVAVFLGYAATLRAAAMMGEAPAGTNKALGGPAINVSWSNPNTILYTCNNPNGFVVLHIVPRNPSGTQPLTYSIGIPGNAASTFTTATSIVTGLLAAPSNQVFTGSIGQSIVVTPITTTTGSISFDIMGFEGS